MIGYVSCLSPWERQEDRCVSLTFAEDPRIMKSQRKIVFQTFGLTNKQKAPSVLRIPKGLSVCQGLVFAGLEQVIQPLADVIADHTCRNGQYKGKNRVHFGSPPLQISSGKSGSYRIPHISTLDNQKTKPEAPHGAPGFCVVLVFSLPRPLRPPAASSSPKGGAKTQRESPCLSPWERCHRR